MVRIRLWTDGDEGKWLGWLDIVEQQRADLPHVGDGYDQVLLLGMGGSSLCPDVLTRTYGERTQGPTLRILDSTVPAHVQRITESIAVDKTLFIVATLL